MEFTGQINSGQETEIMDGHTCSEDIKGCSRSRTHIVLYKLYINTQNLPQKQYKTNIQTHSPPSTHTILPSVSFHFQRVAEYRTHVEGRDHRHHSPRQLQPTSISPIHDITGSSAIRVKLRNATNICNLIAIGCEGHYQVSYVLYLML